MPERLSADAVAAALRDLPGWTCDGGTLRRSLRFDSYMDGMGFVHSIADMAETYGHHPDLMLSYKTVDVSLTTHSQGAVTARDVHLAHLIEARHTLPLASPGAEGTPQLPVPVDLYTPAFLSQRGNSTVVHRVLKELAGAFDIRVLSPDLHLADARPRTPAVLHGLHLTLFQNLRTHFPDRPYVVSVTGTDFNEDAPNPALQDIVFDCLRSAAVVLVYHGSMIRRVHALAPHARVVVVPPAGDLEPTSAPWLRASLGIAPDERLVLLPSGHRPVKDPYMAIEAFRLLQAQGVRAHLVILGTSIDPSTTARLMQAAQMYPWLHVPAPCEHEHMAGAYLDADVVINSSHSEGMPQAITEAMMLGCSVAVRDIEGNRALVSDGVDGRRFADEHDLARVLVDLLTDDGLRHSLAQQARATTIWRSTKLEGDLLALVYEWLWSELRMGGKLRG